MIYADMKTPVALVASLLLTSAASADTCLEITNIRGHAAFSALDYKFEPDGFSNPNKRTFCYDGDKGRFVDEPSYGPGEDGEFSRLGLGTWIWFSIVEGRTEVIEVWSFDLNRMKALLARTRAAGYVLPATTGAYVGDIAAMRSEP